MDRFVIRFIFRDPGIVQLLPCQSLVIAAVAIVVFHRCAMYSMQNVSIVSVCVDTALQNSLWLKKTTDPVTFLLSVQLIWGLITKTSCDFS